MADTLMNALDEIERVGMQRYCASQEIDPTDRTAEALYLAAQLAKMMVTHRRREADSLALDDMAQCDSRVVAAIAQTITDSHAQGRALDALDWEALWASLADVDDVEEQLDVQEVPDVAAGLAALCGDATPVLAAWEEEVGRIALGGWRPGVASPACQEDAVIVERDPCERCGGAMAFKPFHTPAPLYPSYRAYAVCQACGDYWEF